MSEKISIYIPVFNAEKTIKQSINSIKEQSINVNEIIVIDDNSNDNTKEIIKKFSDIKIITNKNNMGLGYSRNLGMNESKNDIVGAIDADVVLDKYWLETLLKNLGKNNIVMCGGKMIERIDNRFNSWRAKYYSQNWGDNNLENPPFLYGCNTIQLKSAWLKVNGYDEKLKTNGEDISFTNKIREQENYKLLYSARALCHHLQDDNLNSLSKRVWRYHSYGYKIKEPSLYRFIKLTIKQLKFFIIRLINNIIKFNFFFIYISFVVFIKFIKLEFCNFIKNKK